jgi:hypothetical protein
MDTTIMALIWYFAIFGLVAIVVGVAGYLVICAIYLIRRLFGRDG